MWRNGQLLTLILIHGGEVDGLECEIPWHVINKGIEYPHIQPLGAPQDYTKGAYDIRYSSSLANNLLVDSNPIVFRGLCKVTGLVCY